LQQSHVVTVTGPVPVASLGVVDAHDHLFLASPAMPGAEFQDRDAAVAEVIEARESGIRTIVDMTPIGLGRRPELLRDVAEATGVHVVAASGYHRDAHYPPGHWVHDAPIDVLAERIVAELERGMHPHDWTDPDAALDEARAGAIKGGGSYHHVTPSERRRLEAIAIAARATGVAVLVHCENGTFGPEMVDLFAGWGLPTDRLLLAHMDRNPDAELHAEIAARGVTLEYDTIARTKYHPDSVVLDLIESVAAAGHLDRIVLGLDLGQRDSFRAHGGGPGLRYLMERFVPRLRRRMGDDAVERILVANPARAFGVAG
jgi:predicted metal-dependent phosphotriesterase family hydrolase